MDWTTAAFVFPGQGSQHVGMGKDFYDAYPVAQATFQQADTILAYALSEMCFDGPEVDLNTTIHTQPALYVSSVALLRVLQQEIPAAKPGFVAGHSLGELTALTAAGALDFETGVKLVQTRARLMHEAGEKQPGGMAAVLGLDIEVIRDICEKATVQSGKQIVPANDNCPGQIVISGDLDALEVAIGMAEAQGAKRMVKLPVSIAAHSPLMQPASDIFRETVQQTVFYTPQMPVYANAIAQPMQSVADIREKLSRQLTNPVRWRESVLAMIDAGAEYFIEIGAGEALTGLVKRTDRSKKRLALNNLTALEQLKSSL